ncbi:MAG: polyheme membrane-associated cytochrome C, partial [Planctomycetota bacterium]
TSAADVQARIDAGSYRFDNIHYLAAGATLYGADAEVGWEYSSNYVGKWNHFTENEPSNNSECTFCHLEDHTFRPQLRAICLDCHEDTPVDEIRLGRLTDYDGDGSNTEPLKAEVETFGTRLFAAIQGWATESGWPIAYDSHSYPYWFNDTNGNGVADNGEATYSNGYNHWDPAMMKAAFNYQMWAKDPGAWAHNTHYILQLLYDAIDDLDGDTEGLTRPDGPDDEV